VIAGARTRSEPGHGKRARRWFTGPALAADHADRGVPAKGGPLLAVRALCGGAGASTLTYLIAKWAARDPAARSGEVPVLACDATTTTGGLAHYAGTESKYSLDQVADALAENRLDPALVMTQAGRGLRIVATRARIVPDGDQAAVARILGDARAAHGLTVVDCGTLANPTSRLALAHATHVVSLLPATEQGARRAERLLDALPPTGRAVEALVARADASSPKAPMRTLTRLADRHAMPLILMPRIQNERGRDTALERCEVTLQAIATLLRR
jgi:hypothetical protein